MESGRHCTLLLAAGLLACAHLAHVHAEDPRPARPTSQALAEAILSGDGATRSRASGWLASMDENQIREVVERIHELHERSSANQPLLRVRVHVTESGKPAHAARVGFRRAADGHGASLARALLRSALEETTWIVTDVGGEAQIALPAAKYGLQLERTGATTLGLRAPDLATLSRPLELKLGRGVLRVRVQDRFGRPCTGFLVDARCQSAALFWHIERMVVGPDGLVTLRGLPPGQWTLRVGGQGGYVVATQTVMAPEVGESDVVTGVQPYGALLLEATTDRGGTPRDVQFILTQGGVRSQIQLTAGERMQMPLPVGEWTLLTDGHKEVLSIREGETVRRSNIR